MEQAAVHYGGYKLVITAPGRDSAARTMLTHPDLPREWLETHLPEMLDRPATDELFAELAEHDDYKSLVHRLKTGMKDHTVIELYDLRSDPGERNNLAEELPDKVQELW